MTTFRKYGGMSFAAKNNIVKSDFSSNTNQFITASLGDANSQIYCKGHLNLDGNSLLGTKAIFFEEDDTQQNTAYTVNQTGILHVNTLKPLDPFGQLTLFGNENGINITDKITFPGLTNPLKISKSFSGSIDITVQQIPCTETTLDPIEVDFDYSRVLLTLQLTNPSSSSLGATCSYYKPVSDATGTFPLIIYLNILSYSQTQTILETPYTFTIHYIAL
jgi:hypothetical protein